MASPSVDLQDAILAILKADSDVNAIVSGRIYDGRPKDGGFPCITLGPSDSIPNDYQCIDGEEISMQLDCWVREGGRIWPARDLADKVKAALHEVDYDLAEHALVTMRASARAFLDADQLTGHGVVSVSASIEVN